MFIVDQNGYVVDTSLDGYAPLIHSLNHIDGGKDPLNGYYVPFKYNPKNYQPPSKSIIGEHIAKIDEALGNIEGGSGFQGPQGYAGAAGVDGIVGVDGVQGYQGLSGSNGTIGLDGAQGWQGNVGTAGSQGNQGRQGIQGSNGNQGNQGNQGNIGTGTQGNQGNQGNIGLVGVQGNQGNQGNIGTGTQGNQGNIGSVGNQGNQGGVGASGAIGATGASGSSGATGPEPPVATRFTNIDSNTVLRYSLDESSAPCLNSGSGGSLDMNLGVNVPAPLTLNCTGIFGKSASTVYTTWNNDPALQTVNTSLGESDSITVSFWLKLARALSGSIFVAKSRYLDQTWVTPYGGIVIGTDSSVRLQVQIVTSGTLRTLVQTGTVPIAVPLLITCTYNSVTGNLYMYINGEVVANYNYGAGVGIDWGSHGRWMIIGGPTTTAPVSNGTFDGLIDELRVENVVRSQEYVRSYYAAGVGLLTELQGVVGASGALGATGATGTQGNQGASGLPGATGASGTPGSPGGATGATGAGASISVVVPNPATRSPLILIDGNGNLTDRSGNAHNLTVATGSTRYMSLLPNSNIQGLLYDGASTHYLNARTAALDLVGDMTIELLVTIHTLGSSGLWLLEYGAAGETQDTNDLYGINMTPIFSGGPPAFNLFWEHDAGVNVSCPGTKPIPICQLVHFTFVRSGTGALTYIDGVLADTYSALTLPNTTGSPSEKLYLGGTDSSGIAGSYFTLGGVQIIGSALTAAQVLADARAQLLWL
jgi:hypothetical protein